MKVGDIIKHKHRGMKRKFVVLGPLDIIQEGDVQTHVLDFAPMCYDFTLTMYHPSIRFDDAGCFGDTVSDEHTHRIYLRPLRKIPRPLKIILDLL